MPLRGINIVCDRLLEGKPNVRYVRLHVTDVSLTIHEIYNSLVEASWVSKLNVYDSVKKGYQLRVKQTTDQIKDLFGDNVDNIDEHTGEYVVSESARKYLIDRLNYMDIPLAELIKQQRKGNPGFDFFSINLENMILFGEAKYRKNDSGCHEAMEQISRFIKTKTDESDLVDLAVFMTPESDRNFAENKKGYVAAFTTLNEPDEQVIRRIRHQASYAELVQYPELICIAIQVVS